LETTLGEHFQLTADDGHQLAAYRARPEQTPRAGLVVLQEIFGVNSHIRAVADGFARDGFLVIAPALFDRVQRDVEIGYTQQDIDKGRALMQSLSHDKVLLDIGAAMGEAQKAGRTGIVGYCWGGAMAWLAAARIPGFMAAVCYYGGSIPALIDERLRCPVMCHWGEKDHAIPMEAVRKIEAAHPEVISYVYPAGHGFNCDQRGSWDAASAELARGRTLEFFQQHLMRA
jgi:carboxymethylenebutenolidase